jgi:hypothetical protein
MSPRPNLPAKRKGLSGVAIGLIVFAVICVLALGTCVAAGFYVGRKAKEMKAEIADGGLILVSPPEVQTALSADKNDYVGLWKATNDSYIDIKPDGIMSFELHDRGGGSEKFTNIAISSFEGNDIVIHPVIKMVIKVSEPPHRVGDHFEMNARGTTFMR